MDNPTQAAEEAKMALRQFAGRLTEIAISGVMSQLPKELTDAYVSAAAIEKSRMERDLAIEARFKRIIRHAKVSIYTPYNPRSEQYDIFLLLNYLDCGASVEIEPKLMGSDDYVEYVAATACHRLANALFLGTTK